MKWGLPAVLALVEHYTLALQLSAKAGTRFGPGHCVSVTQSETKSCVLETRCANQDIGQVEFSFICTNGNKAQKHNFGVGGFDAEESFDTGIQCDVCSLSGHDAAAVALSSQAPKEAIVAPKKEVGAPKTKLERNEVKAPAVSPVVKATAAAAPAHEISEFVSQKTTNFGPDLCISTYKNEKGNCVLKTQCDAEGQGKKKQAQLEQELTEYNIGFICIQGTTNPLCGSRVTREECETASWVNKEVTHGDTCSWNKEAEKCSGESELSEPIRHFFGAGSFALTETFDTNIQCETCDGLDSFSEDVSAQEELQTVKALSQKQLEEMEHLEKEIGELKDTVQALKGPSAVVPMNSAAPAAPVALNHIKRFALKKHKRHHHHRHHAHKVVQEQQEEEEEPETQAETQGEEDSDAGCEGDECEEEGGQ